jgi:hypothetical protein
MNTRMETLLPDEAFEAALPAPLVEVRAAAYGAAHRLGLVSGAGGRKVGAWSREVPSASDPVSEFATAGGEILARRVPADGTCWLSADLAEAAEAALLAEAAEHARVAAAVVAWSLARDSERAAEHGMTVEAYRNKRNAAGHRAHQRSGKNSIGL